MTDETDLLTVQFGTENFGAENASLRVTMSRDEMSRDEVDEQLVGKRIVCTLQGYKKGDTGEEKDLPGISTTTEVSGSFDIKRVSLGPDDYRFTLSGAIQSINAEHFLALRKKKGTITIIESADLPDE